ncbi:hypothetical protein [Macrococcoides caseolyticum]|nr:hypothetical protein [Macrococcus caseolyticus]
MGGMDEDRIDEVDSGFSGLSGIGVFEDKGDVEWVEKEWSLRNWMC